MSLSPEYQAYLHSPAWQAKRREAFAHHGRRCAVCGTRFRLQVHHLTYERLGREQMGDFRILCWKHHKKGRYSALAISQDAKAVWWLGVLDLLALVVFRALRWCLRLVWKLLRRLWRAAVYSPKPFR